MTTVTVFTAERMQEIEDSAIVGGSIVDSHLILERHDGTTIDAGAFDITMLGNLTLGVDAEQYYRYVDATAIELTPNIRTALNDTLMSEDDGDPAWGHWDTDDHNRFIFDAAGFYDVYSYALFSAPASDVGRTRLWISDTVTSGMFESKHESGVDPRVEAQLTTMYEVGNAVRIDVQSTDALDVTYAEIYIRKLNISMEGGAEVGTPSGLRDISFVIDAGDVEISTGIKKSFMRCPYNCTIIGWTILGDQTGSIVIDVWKDSYGNYPPTDSDSITASVPPTVTTNVKATSTTLTGWNTALSAGDILEINVDSITAFTKIVLTLQVEV